MKTVGIIGGIGPESTVAYYRLINAAYLKRITDGSYPKMIINSINLRTLLNLVEANDLAAVADLMVAELERLDRAGVDFGVLSSNTPHLVFDEIQRRAPMPLISIVETARRFSLASGFHKLGLFGTRFTMQARLYADVFARGEMTVISPAAIEQDYIHEKYMTEFLSGASLSETRARLLEIAARLKAEENIEALILGGTELPMVLQPEDGETINLPFVDTSQIHVNAIVEEMIAG